MLTTDLVRVRRCGRAPVPALALVTDMLTTDLVQVRRRGRPRAGRRRRYFPC